MLGVGGNVYTLGIGIGQTELLIDGQPVLKGNHAYHRRAGEMTRNNITCQPSGQWMRSSITAVEHGVVILLCAPRVFIPPLTECRHIVRGDGTYAAIGVARQMTEFHLRVFGHRLQFEAEDFQSVHHPWHAVGHHSKVFGTYQHSCGIYKFGQFAHGFPIPELVVAPVIIVVV